MRGDTQFQLGDQARIQQLRDEGDSAFDGEGVAEFPASSSHRLDGGEQPPVRFRVLVKQGRARMRQDDEWHRGLLVALVAGRISPDENRVAKSSAGKEALTVDRRGDGVGGSEKRAGTVGCEDEGRNHSHARTLTRALCQWPLLACHHDHRLRYLHHARYCLPRLRGHLSFGAAG